MRRGRAKWIGCTTQTIAGMPDQKHVSTSYVEGQNLTMRLSMRRFTLLTNAFSKKWENHAAMVVLYFIYYNFGRVHQTLRVTPAMEAGIASRLEHRGNCRSAGVEAMNETRLSARTPWRC